MDGRSKASPSLAWAEHSGMTKVEHLHLIVNGNPSRRGITSYPANPRERLPNRVSMSVELIFAIAPGNLVNYAR